MESETLHQSDIERETLSLSKRLKKPANHADSCTCFFCMGGSVDDLDFTYHRSKYDNPIADDDQLDYGRMGVYNPNY